MSLKPWREVAVPHRDVLEGTFQQSEFAADISAVHKGKAPREYQDAEAFFERTYITEGMRLLLIQVGQRLNGAGGEPVIQLQTAFGGGKTHTMLAVYHLATRTCSLQDLSGIPALLDGAGLMDVPRARVAILDGNERGPGSPWRHGDHNIHTLWGELAWQLGGAEGYALVRDADLTGTSPGKDALRELLETYAPCVVLVDELVAYVRQFEDGKHLSGGTYDSNLSFIQALTEAIKQVPSAILLASLPESEVEAGSQGKGVVTLKALEKTFGRVQALWKPIATEEAFEIVRRRLFEPIRDVSARDEVCRAFADHYIAEGAKLPSETQEARYLQRLVQAYPIHPEVFDRLYEDWATLEGFQRTRGVLKLMAHVIFRLWNNQNKDLVILPGSLPLGDGGSRNELVAHLPGGWDPVIDTDIDGQRSEAMDLERKETRFGAINAAIRVARTLFLGTAPSSALPRTGARGMDRARVLLGCLQPGQSSSLYLDALSRLADRLHYLNASGDKAQDTTRFWFDTRANLRREMEDRKQRFDEQGAVRGRIAEVLAKLTSARGIFDGVHVFTPHSDIPDDGSLRLVILDPSRHLSKVEHSQCDAAVKDYVRNNGQKPRFKGNRLLFLAADTATVGRLRDSARTALAWASITKDIAEGRLNIDRLQEKQAQKEQETSDAVVIRAARECYRWLVSPRMAAPTDRDILVDTHAMNAGAKSLIDELERVCAENELIITTWSPIHLRTRLRDLYWKDGKTHVKALQVWEDMQRYLYLDRLRSRATFEKAIHTGTPSSDFFGTAYGQVGEHYEGFQLGNVGIQVDDTLLLIDPDAAKAYRAAEEAKREEEARQQQAAREAEQQGASGDTGTSAGSGGATYDVAGRAPSHSVARDGATTVRYGATPPSGGAPTSKAEAKATTFIGSVDINAATAKMKLVTLTEEIISVLTSDPRGTVTITVEINAEYPNGVRDDVKRAVTENAGQLGFKVRSWE